MCPTLWFLLWNMTFYERLVSGHVRLEPGELESLCVFTYGSVCFLCGVTWVVFIVFIFCSYSIYSYIFIRDFTTHGVWNFQSRSIWRISSHRLLLEELYDIWRLGWHGHRLGWRSWPQGQHNFAQLHSQKRHSQLKVQQMFPAWGFLHWLLEFLHCWFKLLVVLGLFKLS